MRIVLIDKIRILRMFRKFFTLEFGLIEYGDLLDILCEEIRSDSHDRERIGKLVYSDLWLQGHHEPYTSEQRKRILEFFMKVRAEIVREIHVGMGFDRYWRIRFIPSDSAMSLKFEYIE